MQANRQMPEVPRPAYLRVLSRVDARVPVDEDRPRSHGSQQQRQMAFVKQNALRCAWWLNFTIDVAQLEQARMRLSPGPHTHAFMAKCRAESAYRDKIKVRCLRRPRCSLPL